MITSPGPYQLTLYFIPSPKGIGWANPSILAKTAIINRLAMKAHFMGHVWVELRNDHRHEMSGMVGDKPDYLNQLILKKKGLGVLFHSFPGKLENKKDIEEEKFLMAQEGRLNFITFTLNEQQAQKALRYLDEYRSQNLGQYYGLVNRPRYKEGSGCSAFGVSFLDLLHILNDEFIQSWSQTIKIPSSLVSSKNRQVSLWKVVSEAKRWASEGEDFVELMFWDPDKMFQWVENKKSSLKKEVLSTNISHDGQRFSLTEFEMKKTEISLSLYGIHQDVSQIQLPDGPIWLN